VYPEATARGANGAAGYELNLNTGREMPFHLSLAPGDGEDEHWYGIDRAILREHARALLGPPAERVFVPIPRRVLLRLLAESTRWHEQEGVARSDDAVLNACRALRYAAEGVWSSKPEAGEWARSRVEDGALADDALAARRGSAGRLDPVRVARFLEAARRSLVAAGGPGAPRRS
jgi:streptomycin 3"-adenylyltransferase